MPFILDITIDWQIGWWEARGNHVVSIVFMGLGPIVEHIALVGNGIDRYGLPIIIHATTARHHTSFFGVGYDRCVVLIIRETKDNLVFHAHKRSVIGRRMIGVVILFTINPDGLCAFGIVGPEGCTIIVIIFCVVINNQSDIWRTVVIKWSDKIDGCPVVVCDGNRATVHQISSRNGNPVIRAAKWWLSGIDHIYCHVARLTIGGTKERDTGDWTGVQIQLISSVDLLRQRIWRITICRKIAVARCRFSNGNSVLYFIKIRYIITCGRNSESVGGQTRNHASISSPSWEHIAFVGCGRQGAGLVGAILSPTAHRAAFFRVGSHANHDGFHKIGYQFCVAIHSKGIGGIWRHRWSVSSPILEIVTCAGRGSERTRLAHIEQSFVSAYRAPSFRADCGSHRIDVVGETENDLVLFRQERARKIGRIGWVDGWAINAICIYRLVSARIERTAAQKRAIVPTIVIIDDQGDIGRAVIIEHLVEIDGGPAIGCKWHVAAEHLVAFRNRNPIRLILKSRLARLDHINVEPTGFGLSRIEERHARDFVRRCSHLSSRVDLLRQWIRIARIGRQVSIGGIGISNGYTLNLFEIGHILCCFRRGKSIGRKVWHYFTVFGPIAEHIAGFRCGGEGNRLPIVMLAYASTHRASRRGIGRSGYVDIVLGKA